MCAVTVMDDVGGVHWNAQHGYNLLNQSSTQCYMVNTLNEGGDMLGRLVRQRDSQSHMRSRKLVHPALCCSGGGV